MKATKWIACGSLMWAAAGAGAGTLVDHRGTYRGISMSRKVEGGIGEYEAVIDDAMVTLRLATGRRVLTVKIPTSHFLPVPEEQMTPEMRGEPGRFTAFRAPQGFPQLYFTREPKTDPDEQGETDFALFVMNEPATESVGPTALFSEQQLFVVSCDELLEPFDDLDEPIPRLPR